MKKQALYNEFSKYYDLFCKDKKYDIETKFIDSLVDRYHLTGKEFLDIACGTGTHAKLLVKEGYTVVGLDKNKGMLKIARKKAPKVKFIQGDMKNFSLNKKFDIVACMFSSLNYVLTKHDLFKTIKNFSKHLKNDGIIILDCPFFINTKKINYSINTKIGKVSALFDFVALKNNRVSVTITLKIPKANKFRVVKDYHALQLYTFTEYINIIKKAGLNYDVYWDYSFNKKRGRRIQLVCRQS